MGNKEEIIYDYRSGYYNADDSIDVPTGAMIPPSSNVIYTRKKKPISLQDLYEVLTTSGAGGSRAYTLDNNLIGVMGNDNSTNKAVGNILQGAYRNLWFVGNTITNGVRVVSNLSSITTIGNLSSTPQLAKYNGSGWDTPVGVGLAPQSTAPELILTTDSTRGSFFSGIVTGSVSGRLARKRNGTISNASDISNVITGDTDSFYMTIPAYTEDGSAAADREWVIYLTYTGRGSQYSHLTFPITLLESRLLPTTKSFAVGAYATGTGVFTSTAHGLANDTKIRFTGAPPSAFVVGTDYYVINSATNTFKLSATLGGAAITGGSDTATTYTLVVQVSDGSGWSDVQGNARIKVVSQHVSTQSERKVEIEFYNNDLLNIEPFDDHYPAGSCKFIAQLGNVTCLVGSGSDSTAFDVSFPNNRESFTPDWRDWFQEAPVSIAHAPQQGMFWVQTANNTYQAIWTGATQESAPVVLRQVTSRYGSIGEGASVCVNGVLYCLTTGKVPVRFAPNGEVDIDFGLRVKDFFSSFTSSTQLGYDEISNSVIYFCGTTAIAYQIDNDIWSASCSVTAPNSIDACFTLNGKMYVCYWATAPTPDTFVIAQWNPTDHASALSWNATSNFQTGGSGLTLKDIIEVRAVTQADAQPYTITFKGYKNYSTSSAQTWFSLTNTATNVKIATRRLLEKIDYESISLRVEGTAGGQTVHTAVITVQIHGIERGR